MLWLPSLPHKMPIARMLHRITFKKGDIPLKDYQGLTLDPKTPYEVDYIIDERKQGRGRQLMVKWKVSNLAGLLGYP